MEILCTQSLCPVCARRIKAHYVQKQDGVYFEKECPVHGSFSTRAADDPEAFIRWIETDTHSVPPKRPLTEVGQGCPYDCGSCPNHKQTACCIVLELTGRCNLSCNVCYAGSGNNAASDPSVGMVEEWFDFLWGLGEDRPFNLQLSGGEPTVRDDLPDIIRMASGKGFPYIQLNTNGLRLAEEAGYARSLKAAGLSAVFLQFDSMDDRVNQIIRGQPLFEKKEQAIRQCRQAGLPVALVPVILPGVNDSDIGNLIQYASRNCDIVKGIHFQPAAYFGRYPVHGEERSTMFDVMRQIEEQTDHAILRENLYPLSSGHSLCSFYSTFLADGDKSFTCTAKYGSGTCCGNSGAAITKDRDFVKDKWRIDQSSDGCCDGLDAFIRDFRRRSLTVTAMQFQDIWNVDLDRVSRCRVQVLTAEKKLVPFCMYNLSDVNGNYLYRTVG